MNRSEGISPSFPEANWPFPGKPTWPVPPWGGNGPLASTQRTTEALPVGLTDLLGMGPELVKRLYCRPDYRQVMRDFGAILLRELEQDREALAAFKEYLEQNGASFEETNRIAPLVAALIVGGAFVGGAILGYLAEEGKSK